jgi:hypothetical protein
MMWRVGTLAEANGLLAEHHYLGPVKTGGARLVCIGEVDGWPVAAQVWRTPTSRRLPSDGSWLELSRWCLTPAAGANGGSRQHRFVTRFLRMEMPAVTTLVSYSDPGQGHTGALYRACNWRWAPTWLRLRPPPTANGNWGHEGKSQHVKDRWVFPVRPDGARADALMVNDRGAIRAFLRSAQADDLGRARRSLATDLVEACT